MAVANFQFRFHLWEVVFICWNVFGVLHGSSPPRVTSSLRSEATESWQTADCLCGLLRKCAGVARCSSASWKWKANHTSCGTMIVPKTTRSVRRSTKTITIALVNACISHSTRCTLLKHVLRSSSTKSFDWPIKVRADLSSATQSTAPSLAHQVLQHQTLIYFVALLSLAAVLNALSFNLNKILTFYQHRWAPLIRCCLLWLDLCLKFHICLVLLDLDRACLSDARTREIGDWGGQSRLCFDGNVGIKT